MPEQPPRAGGRDLGVDVARGVAIVAIVLGHVLRGDAGAGLVAGTDPVFDELDTGLYVWHLAVFAVLAGLFVGPAVERQGWRAYVARRALLLGWLYLVWSLVQGAVKLVTGSLVNTPTSPLGILRELVRPESQLWWLGFLLLASAAAALARPWRPGPVAVASGAAACVVSVLAWGHQGSVLFLQGLGLTAFLWAGAAVGLTGWHRMARAAGLVVAPAAAVATTLLVVTDPMPPTSWTGPADPVALAAGLVTTVAATVAVLALCALLARGRWGRSAPVRLVAALGRRSLEIFLAHIVATAGTRVLLVRLGVTDLLPHLVLGTLAGVTFPLLLWWLTRRVGGRWLFALPDRIAGPTGPTGPARLAR